MLPVRFESSGLGPTGDAFDDASRPRTQTSSELLHESCPLCSSTFLITGTSAREGAQTEQADPSGNIKSLSITREWRHSPLPRYDFGRHCRQRRRARFLTKQSVVLVRNHPQQQTRDICLPPASRPRHHTPTRSQKVSDNRVIAPPTFDATVGPLTRAGRLCDALGEAHTCVT